MNRATVLTPVLPYQLSAYRRVDGALLAPRRDVFVDLWLADARSSITCEESVQVLHAIRELPKVSRTGCLVVLTQVMCELLVPDAIDAVDDRLPFGGAPLTLLQEALGLGL